MKRIAVISVLVLAMLSACKQRPDYVLSDKAMEDLLIDIHKTEAVISLNQSKYPSDDKKRTLREAVFMRHNTTKAQFDSSLVWYSSNLNLYMDVYERVIERLEEENNMIKDLIAQENTQTLTRAGDTIDIWKQERYHIFNSDKGNNVMAFNITTDENFKRNDHFLLQYYVHNAPGTGERPQVYLAIRHNNQTIHYNYANIEHNGWNILKIQSDSVNYLSEIYGYIAMPPRYDHHSMYVDSLCLMRIHDKRGMPRKEYKVMDWNTDKNKKSTDTKEKANKKPRFNKNFEKINKKLLD